MLIGGAPAKEMRPLNEAEILWKLKGTTLYQQLAAHSILTLKEVAPLAAGELNRRRVRE